jgi:hypothetical protein
MGRDVSEQMQQIGEKWVEKKENLYRKLGTRY